MVSNKQELIEKDLAHHLHIFGEVGAKPSIIWDRAQGVRLWDTDGKEYIDLESGGSQYASLGYSRKELIDAAYKQMQKMSHFGTNVPYTNMMVINYAAKLAKILPGDINHAFFVCTGTEANENAIKIAKLYWHASGKSHKYKVICLKDAYHGASHYMASLVGRVQVRTGYGPEASGVVHIPNYHCYRCAFGLKYPDCNIRCAYFLEQTIENEGADSIACMIAEPIQGYAGVIWPPDEYWPIVRKICVEHNILLIADEVQNGFCRTGKFWGVDNWGIVPDIMTLGKGINCAYLPLAVTAVRDQVYHDLKGHVFLGGGTASGNATVVATAMAALQIYLVEKMDERSTKLGEHIHSRLVSEFLPLPYVDDIMGKGCYQSFEVALDKVTGQEVSQEVRNKVAASIMSQLLENGVIPPVVRARRVTITPAFIITEEELDAALDILLKVMRNIKPV